MTISLCRARRAVSPGRRVYVLERQLARFHKRNQAALRHVAGQHPRLADLALSFPALLHAIAFRRRGFAIAEVTAAVIEGKPLADIATLARLPLWTRKLAPECLRHPIPDLPDGDVFRRRILNHLPKPGRYAADWLEMVSFAATWAGEDFAVWCAKNDVHIIPKRHRNGGLKRLTLWAWFSLHAGIVGCRPRGAWSPALSLDSAHQASHNWLDEIWTTIGMARCAGDDWLSPATIGGYDFVPLNSSGDIAEEAQAMNNCLRTFGHVLAENRIRLWSVRRDGKRLASLSVERDYDNPLPRITELKARENDAASDDIWQAASKWLLGHDLLSLCRDRPARQSSLLPGAAWQDQWRPFWRAHGKVPAWLPAHHPFGLWLD